MNMRMKRLLISVVFLLCGLTTGTALAAGQNQVDPDITSGKAARKFINARALWQSKHIRNYQMTITASCFCAGPPTAKVTVRNGKPVRVSAKPWYWPRSVTGLFGVVAKAIVDEAASLDVRYSARLGYPKRISIDSIAMAVDDEITYRVTGFKRLGS